MIRTLQDLTIKDPFMFAAVMSDETQCKRLLSLVLGIEIAIIMHSSIWMHY